jgi:hypothetical protein
MSSGITFALFLALYVTLLFWWVNEVDNGGDDF